MRSFLISIPPKAEVRNVLVFLHGIGEAFLNDANPEKAKDQGLTNLLHHGVPKILDEPCKTLSIADPAQHPLLTDFITIAPQTAKREDFASPDETASIMNQVVDLARTLAGGKPKIAIMGFSRGGFAALQLGARDEVSAIVTMEAAAAKADPRPLMLEDKPWWAFYANYRPDQADRRLRITDRHAALDLVEVDWNETAPPHVRCKTCFPTDIDLNMTDRHNRVCNQVTESRAVYDWILNRLADRA